MQRKGFTLVEMLIVLSIIGILTAIVIPSITVSKAKARDTRRVSDMKEIQLALAVYYDVNRLYPATLDILVTQKYIPSLPADPSGSAYEYLASPTSSYCIGVRLEDIIPADGPVALCTSGASGSTANYKARPPNN